MSDRGRFAAHSHVTGDVYSVATRLRYAGSATTWGGGGPYRVCAAGGQDVPSDQRPPGFGPVRLEQNDVAVLLRSDSLTNIMAATNALFGPGSNQAGSLFKVTSIRRGNSRGAFYGQQGLPSKTALEGHIPGAQSIPRQSQDFLGFSTTLESNMGPGFIANLKALPGLTDQWPNGYFKQGTTVGLSHLF
jgi:hypothetical protein